MKIALIYLIILGSLLTYGAYKNNRQQPNNRHVVQQNVIRGEIHYKKADAKTIELARFLEKYNSPLAGSALDFIEASKKYGLDYKLLVAISGVESTFGNHTPSCARFNVFGYRSSSSPCGWYRFTSYREAIYKVAETISRGNAYARYQRSGQTIDLAFVYTALPADWVSKVNYFIEKI